MVSLKTAHAADALDASVGINLDEAEVAESPIVELFIMVRNCLSWSLLDLSIGTTW